MKTKLGILILVFAAAWARAQTNDLTLLLQQGLLEEQANRNLDAAIADYQTLAAQFDKNRQIAATAIFRLGECYRMLGKTNEAAAQYQRVLKDFSDQPTLATLSRQNLTGMGMAQPDSGKPIERPGGASVEASSLAAQISGIEQLKSDPEEQARAVIAFFPDDVLKNMLPQLAKLQEQAERAKANPQLTVRDLIVRDEDYSVVSFDGKLIRATLLSSGTNLDLFANFQRESGTQLTRIKERVNFVLGIQKARLKVLLAAADSETTPSVSQGKSNAVIIDEESQEIQRIQTMIQNSPDLINRPSSDDVTPLFEAARKDELRVAAFLIDHGADIDAGGGTHGKIWWDWSPLIGAADAGHKAMVELLLKRGADVNRKSGNVGTALCVATKNGFQSVAEVLLANKADVNVSDNSGETPLHLAVKNNNPKIVSMLLERKAGVNAQNGNGATPLIDAAIFNHPEIIKLLLAVDANPNLENNGGRTPLSYAAENGSPEMVKLLLAAKADPNGGTLDAPLLVAIHAKDTNSAELLLQAGVNPNAKGKADWRIQINNRIYENSGVEITPLWLATSEKQFPMVQLLLKFKADPDDSQTDGRPVLFSALNNTNILEALLDAGAKVDARDTVSGNGGRVWNWTPLLNAVQSKSDADSVGILLKHGANPNVRDSDGNTPLHRAAYNVPGKNVFQWLLDSKADPNVRNDQGETPLDILKRVSVGNYGTISPEQKTLAVQLADLLRQHGALDKLPDWDAITVSRPAANFSFAILHKGTNDWNQFTLLEAILNFYEPSQSYSVPQGKNTFAGYSLNSMLPFPDLTRVVILRPRHDSTNETRIVVNLLNGTNGIDCTKDVPLEFGDVVEIPEREHSLGEGAVSLTDAQFHALADYVKGSAKLIAHGQTVELPFYRLGNQAALGVVLKQREAQKVLLSSSDLSRVKIIRHDPKTGKTLEWIVDCSDQQTSSSQAIPQSSSTFQTRLTEIMNRANNAQPSTDLWLCDGDVIEVPEK